MSAPGSDPYRAMWNAEIVRYLDHSRKQGLTPAQAMNRYLKAHNQDSLVPKFAKPFVKEYMKDIRALFYYLSSPDGARWLREGVNLENLFSYIPELLA
jgi:hypothetical protein